MPRLAAAVAAALFTGACLHQLAAARPRDYDNAAATLALHDGCAAVGSAAGVPDVNPGRPLRQPLPLCRSGVFPAAGP